MRINSVNRGSLPHAPGVYLFFAINEQPLYVGKAIDLHKRIGSYYRSALPPKTQRLMAQVSEIEYIETKNEQEALLLEYSLIKKHTPKYNIIFRDDKQYTAVAFTDEAFPRITATRSSHRKRYTAIFGPFPKAFVARMLIQTAMKKFKVRSCSPHVFANRTRPCVWYELEQCTAPCVSMVTEKAYNQQVRNAIEHFHGVSIDRATLSDKIKQASQALDYETAITYRNQLAHLGDSRGEQSGVPRNRDIIAITIFGDKTCFHYRAIRNAVAVVDISIVETSHPLYQHDEFLVAGIMACLKRGPLYPQCTVEVLYPLPHQKKTQHALTKVFMMPITLKVYSAGNHHRALDHQQSITLRAAQQSLSLQDSPQAMLEALHAYAPVFSSIKHIDAMDASHWQGRGALVSSVRFSALGFEKKHYRLYSYYDHSQETENDLLLMRTSLERHLHNIKKNKLPLPQLFCIDGGATHLSQALDTLQAIFPSCDTQCLAIAKGKGRIPGNFTLHYRTSQKVSIHAKKLPALVVKLFQMLTDEAHRFANSRSSMHRTKKTLQSPLLAIAGVGMHRRQVLLNHFGSYAAVRAASQDALEAVPGISSAQAKVIYNTLHEHGD